MTKDELFKTRVQDEKVLDSTGGLLTISLIDSLFAHIKWEPASRKVAYTTTLLWKKLHDRLAPPTLCTRCQRETEVRRFGVLRGDGIWYVPPEMEGMVIVPILADPECPKGTFWILDKKDGGAAVEMLAGDIQ